MLSIIGNGGMGSIKKHIFLLLGLFFSSSHLGAVSPQTVGAMSINEGNMECSEPRWSGYQCDSKPTLCGSLFHTDQACTFNLGK